MRNSPFFFDLASKINRKFSVIPLLYGSTGLQMLVDEDLNPDDIDVCLPQHLYRFNERFDDLQAFMESEGFVMTDKHEHVFERGDIHVNFGVIDGFVPDSIPSIEDFTGINTLDIPVKIDSGAVYRLPTLEQFYKVYSQSLKDSYRSDDNGHKDEGKVALLKRLLNISE